MVRNTLSLLDNFNQITPYAVGFDRIFDNLSRYVDNNVTSTGFPPFMNIMAPAVAAKGLPVIATQCLP